MKVIKFKHLIKEKKLEITWEGEKKEICIDKDEDVDLNDLYDFIIDNIDQVKLEFECENDEYDVAAKVSKTIFKMIETELDEIKKMKKDFSFNKDDKKQLRSSIQNKQLQQTN